jgi:hypothetical protein
MPGTTPNGLPYPLPSEPIADGADAIKNLALALDLPLMARLLTAAGQSVGTAQAAIHFDALDFFMGPSGISYDNSTGLWTLAKAGVVRAEAMVNITGSNPPWWSVSVFQHRAGVPTRRRIRTGAGSQASYVWADLQVQAGDQVSFQGIAATNAPIQAQDTATPATFATVRYLLQK